MNRLLMYFRILIPCLLAAFVCPGRESLVTATETETEIQIETTTRSKRSEPERYFSYKLCDDQNTTPFITVQKVDLQPDPIRINADVHFWLDFTFAKDLPMDTKLGLTLYRHVNLFGLKMKMKVPCVSNVGSCAYNVCYIADLMKEELCKRLPNDKSCQCPFKDGRYVIENGYIKVPQLSETIVSLAMGNYSGQIKVTSGETELACADFTLRLVRLA